MFRTTRHKYRHNLILGSLIVLIVAVAGLAAWGSAQNTSHAIRRQLQDRAETVASLINTTEVSELTGQTSDETAPYYTDLKQTLGGLKASNADIRSLYVTVRKGDKLYFYVDSEKPSSVYYSPPGQYYPDATPFFKSVFVTGKPGVEGPQKDNFGTWVSGLAPIYDDNHKVIAVLGLDIDASYYHKSIIQVSAIPLLLGLLLLGILFLYEWIRLRDQRSLRLRSELVSIASHELRSPLSGIRWSAENLSGHLKGTDHTTVQQILMNTSNLQEAVDSILQLSHLTDAKRSRLEIVDCDMTTLIKSICDTQSLVAKQKSVTIDMDISWQPPVMIRCDVERMKRALNNVLSNAIKYTRAKTSVTVRYAETPTEQQIIISDQGIGIPQAEQAKVFGGFYRASNAKAATEEGTGLGLYLTKLVLEQHGGHVTLKSEEGDGTTITLSLPRK